MIIYISIIIKFNKKKMYRFRRGKKEEGNKEKSEKNTNPEEIRDDNNNNPESEQSNNLKFNPNQNISFTKDIKSAKDTDDDKLKNYSSMSGGNIHKAKSRQIEESKESSDFNINKKLRNTMTGLDNSKMRYESGLIDMILKVERDNVNHYLRGELAEMYNDINRDNYTFKNDVFLANVDHFEKKTGTLDKRNIIPYNCSEDISFKLDSYPKTNEIIDKFTEKIKHFQ